MSRLLITTVLALWATAASAPLWSAPAVEASREGRGASVIPNVTLTTHEGRTVRFYDDLVKGKIVAINLIYTSCKYACPLETARLAQVQKLLGDRMGRDIFFYSISIDPEHDTPEVLNEYSKKFHAGPGWLFLTGQRADIDFLSKKLGLYTPPQSANADGHRPFLLVGNEATGQWMRNSATDNPGFLARTIGDWLDSWRTAKQSPLPAYHEGPRVAFDKGQYTFSSRCSACHTIGRGDNIGPDLYGVTGTRDRAWLTRFIVAPDQMNEEGDPIAVALRAKYKQARMPNLNLSASDAAAVIEYIEKQSRAARAAAVPERVTPAVASEGAKPGSAPLNRRVDLTPLLGSYLLIQRSLHADRLASVQQSANRVAIEAAKLGSDGDAIAAAARSLQQADSLAGARAAFADLSDAILLYSKSMNGGLPAGVRVAYCPMARKHWLQDGEEIRNPFHGAAMSACGRFLTGVQEGRRGTS
jgi:protein SCO1/2